MGTILMAEIVSQASGMPIDEFGAKYLFEPLGIANLSWGHTSKKEVIPSSKRLYMTPRDMGKIGQLILNKGVWGDQQIVSERWIEESTAAQTKITDMDYGYQWWRIPFRLHNIQTTATVATGNGGQYIMIFEEFNMVAVFTGGAYNSEEGKLPFAIVKDIILYSVTKEN
jgi:CubicO group peptidase (beta-lactamase class C family)